MQFNLSKEMSQNFSLFLFEVCALFLLLSFRGEKKKKGLFEEYMVVFRVKH